MQQLTNIQVSNIYINRNKYLHSETDGTSLSLALSLSFSLSLSLSLSLLSLSLLSLSLSLLWLLFSLYNAMQRLTRRQTNTRTQSQSHRDSKSCPRGICHSTEDCLFACCPCKGKLYSELNCTHTYSLKLVGGSDILLCLCSIIFQGWGLPIWAQFSGVQVPTFFGFGSRCFI